MCTTHLKTTRDQLVAWICFSAWSIVPVFVIGFLSSPAYEFNSRVSLCYFPFPTDHFFAFQRKPASFHRCLQEVKVRLWSTEETSAALWSQQQFKVSGQAFTSVIVSSYCGTHVDARCISKYTYFQSNFHCDLSINYQAMTLYWSVTHSLKNSLLPLEQML